MESCKFTYDNDVIINLLNDKKSELFKERICIEFKLRQIITYLINNKYIKNNLIDCGCWLGDNSLPWAKNISGVVYAIDPSPNNCNFINKMCILNDIRNIYLFPIAVSDENKELITDFDIDHCSFAWKNQDNTSNNKTYKVNSYKLDYLFENNEITDVDFIHLDVEGMEMKVLIGSENLINKYFPIIVFEQHLNTDNISELCKFLIEKNYTIFMINEISPITLPDCRNFIAFPERIYSKTLINNIHSSIEDNLLLEVFLNN